MQTHVIADRNDDPILWELCKTSALRLSQKKPDDDVIENHRKDTEAEQDRFKKKKSGTGTFTRIEPTVSTTSPAAAARLVDESRNDVPTSSDSRAAALMSIIAPTKTTPSTQPEKRQRGGWWRRGASTSSGETRDKAFISPPWVTSGKSGARHNTANVSNDSSGVVREAPATTTSTATITTAPITTARPKTKPEAQEDIEQQEENVADNWSLSESLGKLLNDTRQHRVVYRHFGQKPMQSLKVEQTGEMPIPEHDDHVVVKIMASTVTLNDCLLRRGLDFSLATPISLPATPGQDFVGFIVSTGSKVTSRFSPGDRVAGLVRSGGNARFISVSEDNLVPVPRSLDTSEAVCMVSIYASAYQSLKAAVSSAVFSLQGKKVLVIGGMDGAGQAIIQMCRKAKADVYATAPEHRHGYVRSTMGAIPLPESPAEWSLIAEGEMDYVFDGICQDGLESSRKALNKDGGGRLVCFGHGHLIQTDEKMGFLGAPLTARYERFKNEWFVPNTTRLDIWESFEKDKQMYKKHVMSLFQLLQWKKIKPHIAKKVGLDEVGLSHEKLEKGQVRGIVVCLPWKRVANKKIVRTMAEENVN